MIVTISIAVLAFLLGFGSGAAIIAWVANGTIRDQADRIDALETCAWPFPSDLHPPRQGDR